MMDPLLLLQDAAPLPAETPLHGPVLWGIVIPALLLAVATGATVALYRHFANVEESPPDAS